MHNDIVTAWTFVRGAALCFESLAAGHTQLVGDVVALCLPLRVQEGNQSLLVGFLIRHEEAIKLARNMFAQPQGEISPEDLRDAGLEACNVLAGSVIAACGDPCSVEIGLPQALSLDEYLEIARSATVRACFVGKPHRFDDDVRVVMTLFDLPQKVQP